MTQKLTYQIRSIESVSKEEKDWMFELLNHHYANVFRSAFELDLLEKNWAILLFDAQGGELIGFSTQMVFPFLFHDKRNLILYSGDTIIHPDFWGTTTLMRAFVDLFLKIKSDNPGLELYWLLISKGLRTYKYLPILFNRYFPNEKSKTPSHVQEFMDALGVYKFKTLYNPSTGVVKALPNGQFLKEIYHPEIQSNKTYEKFFYHKNPGYMHGDELLCIAELSLDTISPYIKRCMKL